MGIVSAMMQVGAAIKHAVAALFKVTHSLRFDGSGDYLTDTFGTPTDQHTWTLSFWLKKADTEDDSVVFDASGNGDIFYIQTRSNAAASNKLQLLARDATIDVGIRTSAAVTFSEWTHVVVAFNRVASSTNDKLKLWVNGSPAGIDTGYDYRSSIGGSTNIPMNRSGETLNIGRYNANSNYMDGQLAEVHFIDGQALTASDFGETRNGQWVPKEVTGVAYGNNGFYLPFDRKPEGVTLLIRGDTLTDLSGNHTPNNNGATVDNSEYKYSSGGSLLFDGSNDYVAVSNNASLDLGTDDFTIEMWVNLNSTSGNQYFCDLGTNGIALHYNGGFRVWVQADGADATYNTTTTFTAGTWYHVALVREGNTKRVFVDGSQVSSASTSLNSTGQDLTIGAYGSRAQNWINGNIEDIRITKGIARDIAADWTAGVYTSALTNDIQFGSLGRDATTNSNNFAVNGGITPDDQLIDSPNLRFASFDPDTITSSITLSEANLVPTTSSTGDVTVRVNATNFAKSSGKYYFEACYTGTVTTGQGYESGWVATSLAVSTGRPATTSSGYALGTGSPYYTFNNNTVTNQTSLGNVSTNSVARIAVDLDDGKMWIGVDATWIGDPAAGTGNTFSWSPATEMVPYCTPYQSGREQTFNFGQDHTFAGSLSPLTSPYTDDDGNGEFYYEPPSGFKALATSY